MENGAALLDACDATLALPGEDGVPGRTITLAGGDGASMTGDRRAVGPAAVRAAAWSDPPPEAGTRTLTVPVAALGSPIGTLRLVRGGAAPSFSTTDMEIARMFSTHAALVVQHDRLYDEVRALAMESERRALAREMHDSLAQVLAFVNTKAQAVEQYLRRDDLSEARQQMAELSAAAREVYADIRQGIAALRVDAAGKSLRELIEGYATEFAEAARLDLTVDWRLPEGARELTPAAEIQLLRIVQESLANVRRHAGAERVELTATAWGDGLVLTVRDDGRGFDVSARHGDGRPRFGLQTMSERAGAIGGVLSIDSTPGEGTTVTVRWPGDPVESALRRDAHRPRR